MKRACLALLLASSSAIAADTPAKPTLALVGGQVVDGYEGPPIHDGVVLIAGERIVAVGPRSLVTVPPGTPVIDTAGMTVLPGLMDMHVHLMILGHADYEYWDKTYMSRFRDLIMPIAAKQLLMSGVTTVRDLGAPLEDSIEIRRRIEKGEIPGPRLFVSGPFIQHRPYFEYEKFVRWGVEGADDARAKVQKLVDAGVDFIKLIDQDQMTDDEVRTVVETAHKGGKAVVAHAHREDEIRIGLKHNVDCFEHTGLATEPAYPEDILAGLRKRNNTLYWCPTVEGLLLADYTARTFPERLDDPRWQADLPEGDRGRHPPFAPQRHEPRLLHPDLPPPAHPGQQVQAAARHGSDHARGHGQRNPRELPHRLDLARARHLGPVRHDPHAGHRGGHPLARPVLEEGEGPGNVGARPTRRRDRRARRRAHPHRPAAARRRRGEGRPEGEMTGSVS